MLTKISPKELRKFIYVLSYLLEGKWGYFYNTWIAYSMSLTIMVTVASAENGTVKKLGYASLVSAFAAHTKKEARRVTFEW